MLHKYQCGTYIDQGSYLLIFCSLFLGYLSLVCRRLLIAIICLTTTPSFILEICPLALLEEIWSTSLNTMAASSMSGLPRAHLALPMWTLKTIGMLEMQLEEWMEKTWLVGE